MNSKMKRKLSKALDDTDYAIEALSIYTCGQRFDGEAELYINELTRMLDKERKLFDTALNETR